MKTLSPPLLSLLIKRNQNVIINNNGNSVKSQQQLGRKLYYGFILILILIINNSSQFSNAQIIGSSVVTSVSVVEGAPIESTTTEAPTTTPTTTATTTTTTRKTTSTNSPVTTTTSRPTPPTFGTTTTTTSAPIEFSTLQPPSSKPKIIEQEAKEPASSPPSTSSVSSVIATLKHIVEKENIKHTQQQQQLQNSSTKSHDHAVNLEKSGLSYDEDDEVEIDAGGAEIQGKYNNNNKRRVQSPNNNKKKPTTTISPNHDSTTTINNVTATSAEVHEAIHRISGELLTPGKPNRKPIENILTDVLSSINESRNLTGDDDENPTLNLINLISPKATNKKTSGGGNNNNNSKVKGQASSVASASLKPTVAPSTTKKTNSGGSTTTSQQQQQQQNKKNVNNATTKKPNTPANNKNTPKPSLVTATPSRNNSKMSTTTTKPSPATKSTPPMPSSSSISTTPEPQIGTKIVGLPVDGQSSLLDDNLTLEKETEEEFGGGGGGSGKDDFAPFPRPSIINNNNNNNHNHNNHYQKPFKGNNNNNHNHHHFHNENSNNENNNNGGRPTRPQIFYLTSNGGIINAAPNGGQGHGGGGGKRRNGTVHGNRPTEFYDDEIFGYDPYQTFLHGVYIPEIELGGALEPLKDALSAAGSYETTYNHVPGGATTVCTTIPSGSTSSSSLLDQINSQIQLKTKLKQQQQQQSSNNNNKPFIIATTRNPNPTHPQTSSSSSSNNNNQNANANANKPVPNLPDYLHRPRPSHLQYQHSVAESIDSETGLLSSDHDQHHNPDASANERPTTTSPSSPNPNLIPALTSANPAPAPEKFKLEPIQINPGISQGGMEFKLDPPPGLVDMIQHDDAPYFPLYNQKPPANIEQTHGPIEKRPIFTKAPSGNPGLETTITNLDAEMRSFVDINNRLALRLLSSVTNPLSKALVSSPSPSSSSSSSNNNNNNPSSSSSSNPNSTPPPPSSSSLYANIALSPFTIISSLSMLFLGARGATAAQLDGLLHLDDMLTFNPHLLYYNVTQSFLSQPNTAAAIIRLLIADKSKGDVLEFFKTRVQHFYDTRVEEADYKFAGHLAQSIINQMIRAQIQRHSYEMLNYSLPLKGPMSLLTAAFFDGQFGAVRDPSVHDMNFVHLASVGRRLVSVPAIGLLGPHKAVYDLELDATAVEVPYSTRDLSLILIMPGRPGEFGIGGVQSLKSRLTLESWTSLTRGFIARPQFKFIFPQFRSQSTLNVSYTLQRFGLTDMFTSHLAKFKGINGLNDLYLDQNTLHFSEFGTWEKLSDTLNDQQSSSGSGIVNSGGYAVGGNKKFDLVQRILRPQLLREANGPDNGHQVGVGDWIFPSSFLTTNQQQQQQSNPRFNPPPPSNANNANNYFNYRYQPFLSYSQIRSGKSTLTSAPPNQHNHGQHQQFNLSQLFTRGSKVGPTNNNNNNQHHNKRKPSINNHNPYNNYNNNKNKNNSNKNNVNKKNNNNNNNKDDDDDEEPAILRFERPFLYVLRHAPTGMILMCGQYTEPMPNGGL